MTPAEAPLETLDDAFDLQDIGSTLLEDLAKGLYQADEVIREYVQNAVDAHRLWTDRTGSDPDSSIHIEVRGDCLTVYDYGVGMDEQEVRRVKSIAVSSKRDAGVPLTGHKGVGIWAGLSFFERLILNTTHMGSDRGYRLTIEFGKIVESISDDRSIADVLNPNYHIKVYRAEPNDHGTRVTLQKPARSHKTFLCSENVKDAIRRICPCEVDPTFVFGDELAKIYRSKSVELFAIEVNGERVYRSYPGALEQFTYGEITIRDKPVAWFWKALHKKSTILRAQGDQMVGFRMLQSCFALGDVNPYAERVRSGYDDLRVANYLNWYVGEIHVTLPTLRPNLERREFEESDETSLFVQHIRSWYGRLGSETRVISDVRSKLDELDKLENEIRPIVAGADHTDEQISKLISVRSALEADEKTVQSYLRKRNVSSKIAALRHEQVKAHRRRLLTMITEALDYSKSSLFSDQHTDKRQKPEPSPEPVTRTVAARPTDGRPPGSAAPEVFVPEAVVEESAHEEDDADSSPSDAEAAFDVFLGLLGEVLTELLSADNALRRRILDTLRRRWEEAVIRG